MVNINFPYLSVRLLTVFSYFLPFVFFLTTCTSPGTSEEAYNKSDAITNESLRLLGKLSQADTLIKYTKIDRANEDGYLSEMRSLINGNSDNIDNLEQDAELMLLFPTHYSLSGIGTIYHFKNIAGSILVGISLFVSIITLFLWRILNRKRVAVYVISLNLLFVLSFLINCVVSGVSLLYGFWVLIFLLLIQLLTELQKRKEVKKENQQVE